MNKKINIFISYALLIVMFVGIFPSDILANSQSPVNSGLTLVSNPSVSEYSVTAQWTSPNIIPGSGTPNTGQDDPIIGFDLTIENTMTGKKENPVDITAEPDDKGGKKYNPVITKGLENGYLYRFSVIPYHNHTIINPDGTTISQRAPMDTTRASDNQAFFLTDIKVDGTGSGDSMTIVWDKPSELIKNYKISYNKIVSNDSEIPKQAAVEVSINDPNLTIVRDKNNVARYSYKITNSNVISSANMYDVTVEPIFNGGTYKELNEKGSKVALTENNRTIPVTVVDKGDESGVYNCVVTTDLPLTYEEVDSDNIRLIWTGLDEATINGTKQLEVWKSNDKTFKNYTIDQTFYNDGCRQGSALTAKPKTTTYYKVVVSFKPSEDGKVRPDMVSNIVEFNPSMIPFSPNKPNILEAKPVIQDTAYNLSMTWSAFIRQPYTPQEELDTVNGDKKTYVDKDITYDIWLADDISGLYSGKTLPVLSNLSPSVINNVTFIDEKNNSIIAYNTTLTQYSKKTDTGYQNVSIVPNKLYYIKIVAKKVFGEVEMLSDPEYLLVYFNDSGNIFFPPMMSKPPLKIKKDDKGNDMISQTDVSIEWKKEWWEIYNEAKDEWESKFKVENGSLVFGFEGDGEVIKSEDDMKNKILNVLPATVSEKVYYRPVVLDDGVKYELMVLPYSTIEYFAKTNYQNADLPAKEKIYDDYIKKELLPNETPTTSIFTEIKNPNIDATDSQKNTLYTTITGLTPNTEYVILFRAYRAIKDGTRLKSDPAYLTITTLPVDTIITEIPTVPTLMLKEKDDVSITPKWRDDGFKYELVISEKPLDDPGTGTIISSAEIAEKGSKLIADTDIGGNAMYYKIDGLFPSTQYYIWVRAISDTAPKPSAWSSPLQVTTDPLQKPLPPDGLGLASKESLLYIKDADGVEYKAKDVDYLIVEWLKDSKDISGANKSQAASNAFMLGAPEIKSTMLTMFKSLVTNRHYYVRVATRVTVVKGQGGTTKSYSYIVQLADNEDFTDAVQIEIPEEFALTDATTYRTQISDFCEPIKILTVPDDNEYDADKDPDLYPLPDQDYELIYDPVTNTVTYRLRSGEKGSDGMPDNRVDQRVITKLVNSGLYTYDIDVSKYQNRIVKNRIVEIPYTLLEAFKERKIDIKIKADNMTLTLKPNWLSPSQASSVIGYGDASKLKVTMRQGVEILPSLTTNDNIINYISSPQKVEMVLQTPKTTVPIAYTTQPMNIQMKLDNRYDMYDKNIDAYVYNTSTSTWERVNSDYDTQNAEMKFSTSKITSYTAFALNAPYSPEDSDAFKSISNKINITDMKNYKASQSITANQLNNLLYSVAMNKKDVELNKTLTSSQKSALDKAGLSIEETGSSPISRQEAINSIVHLYELKTGSPIKTTSNTAITDINAVASKYQKGIAKAEEIGLLQNENAVRPNDKITLDEASYMINMVLEDSL